MLVNEYAKIRHCRKIICLFDDASSHISLSVIWLPCDLLHTDVYVDIT